jgi:hypothetical protein
VPEISRFFGIIVRMRYGDHGPPHVHVIYGEHEAMIDIESGHVRGHFAPRAPGMALEWTRLRRHQLLEDWDLVRRHLVPKPIAPLD